MGRLPLYSTRSILDAARNLVADEGPAGATMQALATALAAPTGSIYHRFPSRGALLATLWLDAAEAFQNDFLSTLNDPNASPAVVAEHTVTWSMKHPLDARLLLLYRRDELLVADAPADLRARADALGATLAQALRAFARRRLGSASTSNLRRVTFALVDVPYAAVRRHLARGEAVPALLGPLVARAAEAIFTEPSPPAVAVPAPRSPGITASSPKATRSRA